MRKYMNPIGVGGAAAPVTPNFNGPGARMANTRKFGYVMLGIAVLLFMLGGGGFYLLSGQIHSAEKIEADKRAQVGSSQQITSRYDTTLAAYNATSEQLKFLEKPQAQNLYVPTMLPQIQKLALTYDCQIKSITPGVIAANAPAAPPAGSSTAPAGPALNYQIMPVTIDMIGTYSQVMHVVYDLTKFPKIVTVKSISLHPSSGVAAPTGTKATGTKAPALSVEANLQLQTYVFQDDGAPAAGTADATGATTPATAASSTTSTTSDPAVQAINRPISAALKVQAQTQQRVESSGLQSEPMTPTLPTNKNLGK